MLLLGETGCKPHSWSLTISAVNHSFRSHFSRLRFVWHIFPHVPFLGSRPAQFSFWQNLLLLFGQFPAALAFILSFYSFFLVLSFKVAHYIPQFSLLISYWTLIGAVAKTLIAQPLLITFYYSFVFCLHIPNASTDIPDIPILTEFLLSCFSFWFYWLFFFKTLWILIHTIEHLHVK